MQPMTHDRSQQHWPLVRFLDGLAPFAGPLATPHLAAAIGRIGDHRAALSASEREALTAMSAARAAQYSSGRRVARAALCDLGIADADIPRRGRAPVWPSGTAGSIAHSDTLALALAGQRPHFAGVGIDAELHGRVHERLARRVLTGAEYQRHTRDDTATLLFSAKESVYKAVNPLVGEYLGFQDVEITLGNGCYAARTTRACASTSAVLSGEGSFLDAYGHWLTIFLVRHVAP